MDINELREQVIQKNVDDGNRLHVLVGLFMGVALICSLATAFIDHAGWAAAGAILFLALGVLSGRFLERRNLVTEPIRRHH